MGPLDLMVIEKLLSMSGVTSIDVASNGAEGAEAIMSGSYSFVLTDMHMPVMSGVEMVRTVQARAADDAAARAALDRAYVVFLSGSVMSPSDLEDMEAAGTRFRSQCCGRTSFGSWKGLASWHATSRIRLRFFIKVSMFFCCTVLFLCIPNKSKILSH